MSVVVNIGNIGKIGKKVMFGKIQQSTEGVIGVEYLAIDSSDTESDSAVEEDAFVVESSAKGDEVVVKDVVGRELVVVVVSVPSKKMLLRVVDHLVGLGDGVEQLAVLLLEPNALLLQALDVVGHGGQRGVLVRLEAHLGLVQQVAQLSDLRRDAVRPLLLPQVPLQPPLHLLLLVFRHRTRHLLRL